MKNYKTELGDLERNYKNSAIKIVGDLLESFNDKKIVFSEPIDLKNDYKCESIELNDGIRVHLVENGSRIIDRFHKLCFEDIVAITNSVKNNSLVYSWEIYVSSTDDTPNKKDIEKYIKCVPNIFHTKEEAIKGMKTYMKEIIDYFEEVSYLYSKEIPSITLSTRDVVITATIVTYLS